MVESTRGCPVDLGSPTTGLQTATELQVDRHRAAEPSKLEKDVLMWVHAFSATSRRHHFSVARDGNRRREGVGGVHVHTHM